MLVLAAAGGGLVHTRGQISLAAAVVAPEPMDRSPLGVYGEEYHPDAVRARQPHVVDTSFFPSTSAVNPALHATADALRVGDHRLERLG
jgi:hypothetical protein